MRFVRHSFLAVLTVALASSQANAALQFVGSRAALAGTDFIDWESAGPTFSFPTNPFAVLSNGGVNVTVNKTQAGSLQRRNQNDGWNGNFAPGDRLLYTGDFNSNLNAIGLMTFGGNGIAAGGAQIQAVEFGTFTAQIEAFDVNNVSLGSFSLNGNSAFTSDNSAIFLGVRENTTKIFSLKLSILRADRNTAGFAINQFDFTPGDVIPEPATLVLLSILSLAVGTCCRWPRQNIA